MKLKEKSETGKLRMI